MAEIIRMPKMSDTMTEGVIASWLKKVGDKVKSGDILAEVETDKATMELENYEDGTLLYIGPKDGEAVAVDGVLAIIGEEGADVQALLDDLELRTFRYFWDTANPANGLVPDRWPGNPRLASIAAVGFALTAYVAGVDAGFVTREAARERVLVTARFFANAPQGPAYLGTAGELGLPVLLVLGLGTRFAALGLSFVNVMAVLSLAEIAPAALAGHHLWGVLLVVIALWGAGRWSVDAFSPTRAAGN